MDNTNVEFKKDHLAEDVITVGKSLVSSAGNLAKGIRDKAKAKAAQKTADAGGYWTLRPYLKSLIPIPQYIITQVSGQGITEYAVLQLPAQQTGASNTQIITALKQLSGSGGTGATNVNPTGNTAIGGEAPATDLKKFLPYVLVLVVLVVLYYIIKK